MMQSNEVGNDASLKPKHTTIQLTYETRIEWANSVEENRLHEFTPQIEAMKSGLASSLPINLLNLFAWQEMNILVCGSPMMDIEILKKATDYSGLSPNSPTVKMFWKVLESFSQEERSLFLRFVWGRSRLPSVINTQFAIQLLRHQKNPDELLPESHTCVFTLDLPEYSSYEIMRSKLLYAIHEGASIDRDYNVGASDTWE